MDKTEAVLLLRFLDELEDVQGFAESNDLALPNTSKIFRVLRDMYESIGGHLEETTDDELLVQDWELLVHLKEKFIEHFKLTPADLKEI